MEQDVQAESRNHRGGSLEAGHKKITRIDLVTPNTLDEIISDALDRKLKTNEEILTLLRKRL